MLSYSFSMSFNPSLMSFTKSLALSIKSLNCSFNSSWLNSAALSDISSENFSNSFFCSSVMSCKTFFPFFGLISVNSFQKLNLLSEKFFRCYVTFVISLHFIFRSLKARLRNARTDRRPSSVTPLRRRKMRGIFQRSFIEYSTEPHKIETFS